MRVDVKLMKVFRKNEKVLLIALLPVFFLSVWLYVLLWVLKSPKEAADPYYHYGNVFVLPISFRVLFSIMKTLFKRAK